MFTDRVTRIPVSAQCMIGGPSVWSMSHPSAGRMDLCFPAAAKSPMLTWWVMHVGIGLAVALYGWLSYGLLWPDFQWEHIKYFLIVSVCFWAYLFVAYPGDRVLVHELTIDRTARTMAGTGIVYGKRVQFVVPIAAVKKVNYFAGSSANSRGATLEMLVARPHRAMRFPTLASVDKELCDWICAMLGKPLTVHK